MRATGILRRVDDLGRVVIPKEIRREMRIREGDPLEVFVDKNEGLVCFQRYDIEKNYLAELKRLSDSIAEQYWSPENSDNLKIINIAIHEIELQLKAIAEREE
jgi:stage V sporulation protein T